MFQCESICSSERFNTSGGHALVKVIGVKVCWVLDVYNCLFNHFGKRVSISMNNCAKVERDFKEYFHPKLILYTCM